LELKISGKSRSNAKKNLSESFPAMTFEIQILRCEWESPFQVTVTSKKIEQ
jgi:hypothetical protein